MKAIIISIALLLTTSAAKAVFYNVDDINTAIQDHDWRIEVLEKKVRYLEGNISQLQSDISQLQSKIHCLDHAIVWHDPAGCP
jgi:peptidoglycan hydrolase CwlO-like protein